MHIFCLLISFYKPGIFMNFMLMFAGKVFLYLVYENYCAALLVDLLRLWFFTPYNPISPEDAAAKHVGGLCCAF